MGLTIEEQQVDIVDDHCKLSIYSNMSAHLMMAIVDPCQIIVFGNGHIYILYVKSIRNGHIYMFYVKSIQKG